MGVDSLLYLIIVIAIIGVVVWAVGALVPMSERMRTLINVVAVVAVLLWLAKFLMHGL